jgi:hypothetical protein
MCQHYVPFDDKTDLTGKAIFFYFIKSLLLPQRNLPMKIHQQGTALYAQSLKNNYLHNNIFDNKPTKQTNITQFDEQYEINPKQNFIAH